MGRAIITVSTRDFNPRPREGGDYDKTLIRLYAGISIHAPARGATGCRVSAKRLSVNFNPRPREGGDGAGRYFWYHVRYFNPRPREGGDL